jgi:hypothetical protein
MQYDNIWIVSSEPGLPLWLTGRDNRECKKFSMVPTEKIIVFRLDSLHNDFLQIPYEEYKSWKGYESYPTSGPTQPLLPSPVREYPNNSNVVDITKKVISIDPSKILKAGDKVIFSLEDSKEEDGAEVLIGHPIFEDEVDKNMFVRFVTPRGTNTDDVIKQYFKHDYWQGDVQHFRFLGGLPIIFAKNIEPYHRVVDESGFSSDGAELGDALKTQGCKDCQSKMTLDEAKKGIARKRKDGSWRLICPDCLESTLHRVQNQKPGISMRERQVN